MPVGRVAVQGGRYLFRELREVFRRPLRKEVLLHPVAIGVERSPERQQAFVACQESRARFLFGSVDLLNFPERIQTGDQQERKQSAETGK